MTCGCSGVVCASVGAGVAVGRVGVAGVAGVAGLCVEGGVAGGCGFANPWASVACLWIGFEGWLFGGLTLLGPPAISLSEAFFVP